MIRDQRTLRRAAAHGGDERRLATAGDHMPHMRTSVGYHFIATELTAARAHVVFVGNSALGVATWHAHDGSSR